ncbi:MAG: M20 family metallopeptidase [Anaerolineae bacterium]
MTHLSDQILSYLYTIEPDFLADLAALVNLDCGTENKAGVDRVGAWIRERCLTWGWEVEHFPLADYGDCWLARLRGRGSGRIMLIGHLDTVYPDGTAARRPMRFEGAKILGPGTCDMKGGLLVGMYAMRALQVNGFADFAELLFFFNSEEEMGSPVSRSLFTPLAQQMEAVLVLESARMNGDIVSARKGAGVYHVKVKGKSAHAGVEPEKGANAILEMAHQVIAFQKLNGVAPGVTANVGVISGGVKHNVVPDEAILEVDVRAIDLAGVAAVRHAVAQLNGPATVPGTQVQIQGGFTYFPMAKNRAIGFLVQLAQESAQELGFAVKDAATGGASDANQMAALEVPVLDGLGPVGGLDHGPDEYIEQDSIVPRTAMLAGLIQRILARREELARLRQGV